MKDNSYTSQPDPGMPGKSSKGDILIVDDSLPNLRTLSALLAEQGYKVRGARDGSTALMIAQGRAPDLILLDIRMPGMDGYQVCRRLKGETETHDIPVIFISALDEVVDKVKGFDAGGVDFIIKPFQIEDVLARIETHLALRALQKQLEAQNAQLQREVAERVRAEEALQRTHKELIRQERLSTLGELTATVAHEIRNPLGTVRTSVFAIGDAIKRDEMHRVERALQLAERNIVRCDKIISQLLDYTRDRALQRAPTYIDKWLAVVLDEQDIPPGIVCTRELKTGLKMLIDHEQLRRAITHVVSNATDALQDRPAPGNQLTVSTHIVEDQASPRLEIRVHDTGPGIPDDVRDKIFEPLFSTKSFGVGLGLPIAKNVMEQHQGGIKIDTTTDLGTTVTLWLPIPGHEEG
jgi:two-component system NtrC family sensor kinase